MVSTYIDTRSLCSDATYTLLKIVSRMKWEWKHTLDTEIEVTYPEADEDIFDFICGELIQLFNLEV